MSDFLNNLVARSLGRAAVVEPRRPSIFEPVRSGLIAPVEGSLSSEEKAEWAGESVEEIEVPRFEFSRPSRRESRGLANTERREADDRFASKSVAIDRKQSQMSQAAQQLAQARHGNAKDRFALKSPPVDRLQLRTPHFAPEQDWKLDHPRDLNLLSHAAKELLEWPGRQLRAARVSTSLVLNDAEPLSDGGDSAVPQKHAASMLRREAEGPPSTATALASFAGPETSLLPSETIESQPASAILLNSSIAPRAAAVLTSRADTTQPAVFLLPRSEVIVPLVGMRNPFGMPDRSRNNEPSIHVSIGRIEVRAVAAEAEVKRTERLASPVTSLNEYLQQQAKRRGQ